MMATSDRQQADVATCPECATRARPDGDELYCPACGYVLESNRIDHGPEWRDAYDPNARTNGKRTKASDRVLQDRGLGSEIGTDGGTDRAWDRLKTRNQWARADKKDRGRGYATTEIHRMTTALEPPGDWGDQAKRLFTSVHEREDLGGHYSLDALAAAAVYAICRVQQRGLTPADVATVARCDPDRLRRTYGYLQRETSLQAPPPDAEQRLRVVAREADMVSDAVREDALDLLERVSDHERSRGSPSTLAAALLWVAGEDVTQAGVGEAAGVTPNAIRMRWRRVSEGLSGVDA